jgi:hypothetical protein
MQAIPIERQVLALTDDQLERFVREWTTHKKEYVEVQRFTGPGDMGRDVVGYLTNERHEGPWHNYQCKQYARTLPTALGIAELGKILYYSHHGQFTVPAAYFFVAPRNVNRNLKRYISKPSELKQVLLTAWDEYCAKTIVEGQIVRLTPELAEHITAWDSSSVKTISLDDILLDPAAKPVLASWFGVDPGPAPLGVVPENIEDHEMHYIQQLLDAYGERSSCTIAKEQALAHPTHGSHLKIQRERFFDADAFTRFYRDNTMQAEIDILRRDMRHGIAETHAADHADSLRRHDAVMTQASVVSPSGPLAKHAGVPVSALETGVRAVVVLDAAYPRAFDLAQLTWLDHLVVHTADIGGPASLHPDIPQRTGELLVRRRLVEDGLHLMRRLHLVDGATSDAGIVYTATDEATAFVESMRSSYARELRQRARWLARYVNNISPDALAKLIADRIGRWAVEFQGEVGPQGKLL